MSGRPDPINVLMSTDRGGVLGAAVTGRSIAENANGARPLNFHLFHGGLDDRTLHRLEASWSIPGRVSKLIPMVFAIDRVRDLLRSRDIPHMAYARLFLDDIMANSATRCVYTDIDVLFERDIEELHDMPLDGAVLGAVPNSTPEEDQAQLQRLGVSGARYFNTGVLSIDVEVWREYDVAGKTLVLARSAGDHLKMHDQDALNVVLAGQWKPLPQYWNFWWPGGFDGDEPVVIHMAMSPKPWQMGYAGPHADRFFAYLDRTAFAGRRPLQLGPLGTVAWRAKRSIPYWPTVWRRLRRLFPD
jgi:lipopolysaccharide biosynthesis glycosyltransferase